MFLYIAAVSPSIQHLEKCYIRLDSEGKCLKYGQVWAKKFACCCSIGVAWGSRCELCPPVGSGAKIELKINQTIAELATEVKMFLLAVNIIKS